MEKESKNKLIGYAVSFIFGSVITGLLVWILASKGGGQYYDMLQKQQEVLYKEYQHNIDSIEGRKVEAQRKAANYMLAADSIILHIQSIKEKQKAANENLNYIENTVDGWNERQLDSFFSIHK